MHPSALAWRLSAPAGAAILAMALAAMPAQAAPIDLDLPAQPLPDAIKALARSAGVTIAADSALLAGRNAPAVRGRLEPSQALARLLAGSGLEARIDGQTVTIVPTAPQSRADTLAPVTVSAAAMRDGTTEGSGSYRARFTNTATRLTLSPRETPQTITVVTRQQMEDAGMTSVDDALRAVSGTQVMNSGPDGNPQYSRGFALQYQFDGMAMPGDIGYAHAPQIDSAFLDRLEVLQGASGLLMGAGQPGGTINLVRKRPADTFQAQAEVQLGSWNGRRLVGDVSGPLTASGRIRGRLVALADNTDSFTDYVYRNRRGVYGIVEADLSPGTLFSASVQYQKDRSRSHFGVPFANLARSSFFGEPHNRVTKDDTIYTLDLSQRLAGDWNLKASYARRVGDNEYLNNGSPSGNLDVVSGDGLTFSRSRRFDRSVNSHGLDVYASGPFHLLGRKHELALGMNGSVSRSESLHAGTAARVPINVYTFDPASLGTVPEGGTPSPNRRKTTSLGLYGVARWSLADSLKLITGVRVSSHEVKNFITGQVAPKETGVVTPYAGLVYDLNSQFSAYVSYSDIFNPQTNRSADGGVLQPVVGANYEAGIKGELLDKRLNVSAALFRLEQTNLALLDDSVPPDPGNACGGSCYTASGKVVSQGVDLGVNGQVGQGLNLFAGYTYTNAEYAAGPQKGQRFNTRNQPQHSLRLAAHYQLPGTAWSVGGNVAATSKTYNSGGSGVNAWTMRQGALVLVGLNAKYRIGPKTEVNFAVSNLTDRSYRILFNKDYTPFGEPRKFTVALKHRF